MSKNPAQKRRNNLLVVMLILVIVGSFFGSFFFNFSSLQKLSKQIPGFKPPPTAIPTQSPPSRPLDQGKQVYNVSRGSGSRGPAITQVIFDPFDPKKGEIQAIALKIAHNLPVTAVSTTLTTDHKTQVYPLTLKEGTSSAGLWNGSWKTTDSHDYKYVFAFEADDGKEKSKLEFPIR